MFTGVIITILASGAIMPYTGVRCGDVGGTFIEGTNIIYVCELGDGRTRFYEQHELGHWVWENKLTEENRKEYTIAYNSQLKRGTRNFYRKYSMTSVKEDFADNYAIRNTNKNPLLKRRIALIKGYLKNHK